MPSRSFVGLIMVALGSVALQACSSASDLEISNETAETVTAISVSDGQSTWHLGKLAGGRSLRFRQTLEGEGGAIISWTYRGKQHQEGSCYYTYGSPAGGKVIIAGDELKFRCG
jgi:hypothetical protein